jgi:hypothetical protein
MEVTGELTSKTVGFCVRVRVRVRVRARACVCVALWWRNLKREVKLSSRNKL